MIKKFYKWYRGLPTAKKLLASFILNWFYWLIAWLIAEKIFFDESRSWKYHLVHATWMSFFMTITYNWKGVKQIFNNKKKK